MIDTCPDGWVGEGTRNSFRLWVQCFCLYCMLIMIACTHWPDCVWLKLSLTLFVIVPWFGAQKAMCTRHRRAKQVSVSEHKRKLFKDPPKDSYLVHLGTVSVQQNSLILWDWHLMVEGWAQFPYVLTLAQGSISVGCNRGHAKQEWALGNTWQLWSAFRFSAAPSWAMEELYHMHTLSLIPLSIPRRSVGGKCCYPIAPDGRHDGIHLTSFICQGHSAL